MTAEASVSERPTRRHVLDRFDQALLAAKNSGRVVRFCLAVDTAHTDEDGVIDGFVCQVDKYQIEIQELNGTKIWISRQAIITTWIAPE